MTTIPHSQSSGVPLAAPPRNVRLELAGALQRAVEGEVRFDDGSRALYSTDASNYRQVPIGVVIPRSVEDVIATVETARRFDAPVLPRGGGTSLAGQTCNVAVVMDMSKYVNRILRLDPDRRRAVVQPGLVLDTLRDAAEQHHLTFAPDPSTHDHCTLGGMIGNNSCGVHSIMGGKTSDNVQSLDVLTYDGLRLHVGATPEDELAEIVAAGGRRGEIYAALRTLRDRYATLIRQRYPDIPRCVSGYALNELLPEHGFNVARALVGSEGTCVTVLQAELRLVPSPPARSLLLLGYPDVYAAGDDIPEIMQYGPVGLEGLDERLVDDMHKKGLRLRDVALLPAGAGWLLVEFGGDTREEADDQAHRLMDALKRRSQPPTMHLYDRPSNEHLIWKVRESGLGATARVPGEPDSWEGWEDSAVDPAQLGDYLRGLRQLFNRYGYNCALYGHFGQGCVHTRIDFDLKSRPGIDKYLAFLDDAADLVLSHGGSLSGEHGDGQSRASLLPKMFGPELVQAFEEFKAIWDPRGKMNPGKVVHPYQPDENLRFGSTYQPATPYTHFRFPEDHGSFTYALERCVGVGECRRHGGGTMCPSYMVTREEQHSTRGRARLLEEMLRGDVLEGGWREDAVREALDLCLACKGCKGDCPVNVDMATYKAEFYSHYYARRLRPVAAYSMGLIQRWAPIASFDPGAANLMTRAPLVGSIVKRLGGIAGERTVPAFAPQTLRDWFEARPAPPAPKPRVLLWPDTFTNYFLPARGRAAVEVLEHAGYQVTLPPQPLCCGRPLYDWGMLDQARRYWLDILEALAPQIDGGVPLVGLEPSCVSAFRDELLGLLPENPRAQRLSKQTYTLSEFLVGVADWQPPTMRRHAIVQAHCHHRAVMKLDADHELMRRLGLDADFLEAGCCGMAGAFGFERGEHYEVSRAAGERVLLPTIRGADADTLVIADGFSCQEQIAQGTDRGALHLAEVLAMALHGDPPTSYPERPWADPVVTRPRSATIAAGAGAVALGLGTLALLGRVRSR